MLAHSLGKKVTAEGVETIQQFEWLQSKNCDLVQGFYFSPGLPPKDMKDLPTSIGSEGDFT